MGTTKTRMQQLNDLLLWEVSALQRAYKSLSMCLDDGNYHVAKRSLSRILYSQGAIDQFINELNQLLENEIQTQQAQQAQQKKV